jgi:hypothetical protein
LPASRIGFTHPLVAAPGLRPGVQHVLLMLERLRMPMLFAVDGDVETRILVVKDRDQR